MHVLAPPRFDPLDQAFRENPYPLYESLRAAGPINRAGPGQWVVARHADVSALLLDPRLSADFTELHYRMWLGDGSGAALAHRVARLRDGSVHRSLAQRVLAAGPPEALRAGIVGLVDGITRSAVGRGHVDLVSELAVPVAAAVAGELVGLPDADRAWVAERVGRLAPAIDGALVRAEWPDLDRAADELQEYISALLGDPARPPQLEAVASAVAGVDATAVVALLVEAIDPAVRLIGAGCRALLERPDQLARLRARPDLVPAAVEEFLRWQAPVPAVRRTSVEALRIGGQTVRPGRTVHLLLGSANRDERCFESPELVDVGRDPNPHVSFGGGLHACLGSRLARFEAGVVFGRLVQRSSVLAA